MGRGRQKAKQTKVARELKYQSPQTDFKSLERELSGKPTTGRTPHSGGDHDDDDDYDEWDASERR